MIASKITLDIDLNHWMEYAFTAIPNFILFAVIIIFATLLLSFVVAIGWGFCWNRRWSLSKSGRWFMVGILAVVAAACLAARDSLCNGGLGSFFGESSKITAAFNGEPISKDDSKSAYEIAELCARLFPHPQTLPDGIDDDGLSTDEKPSDVVGDDTTTTLDDLQTRYVVPRASREAYERCYGVLTYVPLLCFLFLLIVIPCVSYRDIRLIYPVPTEDDK